MAKFEDKLWPSLKRKPWGNVKEKSWPSLMENHGQVWRKIMAKFEGKIIGDANPEAPTKNPLIQTKNLIVSSNIKMHSKETTRA
jgi:hypothetical protein